MSECVARCGNSLRAWRRQAVDRHSHIRFPIRQVNLAGLIIILTGARTTPCHGMKPPPFTQSTCPVMKPLAGDSRKSIGPTISSGSARRFIGVMAR